MEKIEQVNGHSVVANWIGADSKVLDLGANLGAFSKEAHRRFGCASYAVEPNEKLHGELRPPAVRRLFPTLVTLDGRDVTFSIAENSECSSIFETQQSEVVDTKPLKSTSFRELLACHGEARTDWVKMDIEGAEIEILNGSDAEDLLTIDQLSVEFHESNGLSKVEEVRDCIARMRTFGFRVHRGSVSDFSDVLFVNPRCKLAAFWPLVFLWWRLANGINRALRRLAGKSNVDPANS
jgi:FkbM family methyltransferase